MYKFLIIWEIFQLYKFHINLYIIYSKILFSEKYPEIKKLFGYDPNFKWVVTGMVLIQIMMLFVMKGQSWPITLLVAYFFGGVINHALMLGKCFLFSHYYHPECAIKLFRGNFRCFYKYNTKSVDDLVDKELIGTWNKTRIAVFIADKNRLHSTGCRYVFFYCIITIVLWKLYEYHKTEPNKINICVHDFII